MTTAERHSSSIPLILLMAACFTTSLLQLLLLSSDKRYSQRSEGLQNHRRGLTVCMIPKRNAGYGSEAAEGRSECRGSALRCASRVLSPLLPPSAAPLLRSPPLPLSLPRPERVCVSVCPALVVAPAERGERGRPPPPNAPIGCYLVPRHPSSVSTMRVT